MTENKKLNSNKKAAVQAATKNTAKSRDFVALDDVDLLRIIINNNPVLKNQVLAKIEAILSGSKPADKKK